MTAAMQEECIRMTENRNLRSKENNPVRPVYRVGEFSRNAEVPVTKKPYRTESEEKRRIVRKCYGCNSVMHLYKDCPKRKITNEKSLNVRVSRQ